MRSLLVLLLLLACAVAGQDRPAPPPNVVLILADDLGSGDLGCYGHPYARTPNLDQLARDGLRFTQFYANGVTCCPSRTSWMTGKFPASFAAYPDGAGFGARTTVTELLSKAGYRIGHFGKWHIGPRAEAGVYGVDEFAAGTAKGKARKAANERGRDAGIFDAALEFIERNREGPFYVNVWGHIAHNPIEPAEALVERWKELEVDADAFPAPMREKLAAVEAAGGDVDDAMRRYLAEVEALDADVGRLLERLDELELRENTIVVFSSDQGADMTKAHLGGLRSRQMGSNGELRGGKHTHYEGGVRAPLLVRWPAKAPAGRVDGTSVCSAVDWLPTLCSVVGLALPSEGFDGEDMSSVWRGEARARTRALFWKLNNERSELVVRDGRWKLFVPHGKRGELQLYDVHSDPGETRNVAADNAELVAKLRAQLETWNATLPAEYSKSDAGDD
jgi:N-acetylgalactosamine-6-sulfatase